MGFGQPAARLGPADPREASVEQHDVGVGALHELGQGVGRAAFADDLEVGIGAEDGTQTLPHHLVVVDEHQPDHAHPARAPSRRSGTLTRMVSPPSSPLATSKLPPRPMTDSRMWRSPKCSRLSGNWRRTGSGAPTPSSWTTRSSRSVP